MSLQGDFLASLSAMPGSAEARKMTVISGRRCLELLARSGRAGSWARTFSGFLTGMEGWFSTRCYLTWKLKAMKSGRMLCQLRVSTLRIKDTASGSWPLTASIPPQGLRKLIPTPIALDGASPEFAGKLRRQETPEGAGKLTSYVRYNWEKLILPEQAAEIAKPVATVKQAQQSKSSKQLEEGRGKTTKTAERGRLETPSSPPLETLPQLNGETGQLNPRFVAEMMGFPYNWTEKPFRNGEPNP
jgi:hypothetical protein